MKAVFDTNILIDYLAGAATARTELSRYQESYISIITWMEVLVGAKGEEEERIVRSFLSGFRMIQLTHSIAEKAIELRKMHKLHLPDAIVWATATDLGFLLVTRDKDSFPKDNPSIRIPY